MKLLNRLCSILTFLPLIVSALLLPLMPQQIPAHYNLSGQIDRWGSPAGTAAAPAADPRRRPTGPPSAHPASDAQKSQQLHTGTHSRPVLRAGRLQSADRRDALFRPQQRQLCRAGRSLCPHRQCADGADADSDGQHYAQGQAQRRLCLRTKWSMANDACWNRCQRMAAEPDGHRRAHRAGCAAAAAGLQHGAVLLLILLDAVFSTVYSYQVYQKYGRN